MANNIKGRKRQILVDTLGPLLGIGVTPANISERDGAQALLRRRLTVFTWLRLIWADASYAGPDFALRVRNLLSKLQVQIVRRSDSGGFKVLPRRWLVERAFAWFMRHRRLVRDYETSETSAESWAYIAMIRIQLRRLA